jgi:tripartite-type tricarboxylate transporter receptor subunit TctC
VPKADIQAAFGYYCLVGKGAQVRGASPVKLPRRKFLHLVAGAAVLPTAPRTAWTLDYPTRPVHIIDGFNAGGGPSIVARLLSEPLSQRLRQQFVVEDRPRAGSSIAADYVVNAPADGYILLMATAANTINTTLYPNLKFDFARDFAPVAIVNSAPFVMVVTPSFPAKTVTEFITFAKAHPGKINMASPGFGTTPHLCYELLKTMTGVDLVHVPYRASYIPDLISGQVQVAFSTVAQAISYVQAGKLRALAVTSAMHVDALPSAPTMGEFVPSYESESWFGIVAPKRTAAKIIDMLNREINAVVAEPQMKSRLVALGTPPMSMTPTEFGKLIAQYTEKWAKVIRAANITMQ